VLIQQGLTVNTSLSSNLPSFKQILSSKNIAILLLLSDFIGLLLCLKLSAGLGLGEFNVGFDLLFSGFLVLVLLGLYLGDTYRPDSQLEGLRAPARIFVANVLTGTITATAIYLLELWGNIRFAGHGLWMPTLALFTVWAVLTRFCSAKWIRNHMGQRQWLLLEVDASNRASRERVSLTEAAIGKFTVLRSSAETSSQPADLTTVDTLATYLAQPWTGVIVSDQLQLSDAQTRQLMQARLRGVQVMSPQDFHENYRFRIPANTLQDSWFLMTAGFNLFRSRVSWKLKRVVDISATSLMLVVLAPIMLLAAIAVKLDSPGSILYSQIRTGLNGESFKVYKFRSMYQDAESRGAQWASERDPRITRVGYWLRILRIDELPQIWNVLRGEMSLIGPRPERPEFDVKLAEAIPYYQLRYLVKPGITGWAQVMYPYGASVEDAYEKFAYDLYYIKNFSFWLDIAIVLKTIRVVLLGKGR
jgi:exopolysaccharide biosynthesis polyprenyl glycosylphosphotransferase